MLQIYHSQAWQLPLSYVVLNRLKWTIFHSRSFPKISREIYISSQSWRRIKFRKDKRINPRRYEKIILTAAAPYARGVVSDTSFTTVTKRVCKIKRTKHFAVWIMTLFSLSSSTHLVLDLITFAVALELSSSFPGTSTRIPRKHARTVSRNRNRTLCQILRHSKPPRREVNSLFPSRLRSPELSTIL